MATQTITQRIALTGGAEIRAELSALGKDGEAAFLKLQAAANNLKGPGDAFGASLRSAGQQLTSIGKLLDDAGAKMATFGKSLSEFVTVPLLGIGAVAVKGFSEFESALAEVSGKVDLSKESLTAIGEQIRQLSTTTPVGLNDLVKAFGQIRGAGISAADGMKVLQQSAKLAVAANSDVATAANVATSAINAFGLTGDKQAKVFDLLFRATEGGKVSLQDLADSFGKMGNTIRASNVQLDEYLVAIASLAKGGLSATAAQRDLNTIITKMLGSTKEVDEALIHVGAKSFPDLVAKSGGLVGALDKLAKSTGNNSEALSKLFGSEQAVGTVLALVGPQFAEFNNELAASRGNVSALDAQYARMRNTTKATFQELANQLQNVAIDIGSDLVGPLTQVVAGIEKVANAFHGLSDGQKKFIVDAGILAATVGPVILILGKLIQALGFLATAAGTVIELFTGAGGLVVAIGAVAGPVTIVVAAVTALVGGFFILNNTLGDISKAAQDHANSMSALQSAYEGVQKGVAGASEAFRKVAQDGVAAAQAAVLEAQAQVKATQTILDQDKARAANTRPGVMDNAIREAQGQLDRALAILQQRQGELASLQAQIAKDGGDSVKSVGDTATAVGEATNTTAQKVSSTVTVLRGNVKRAGSDISGIAQQTVTLTNGVNTQLDASTAALGKLGQAAQGTLTPIAGVVAGIKAGGDGVLRITDASGKAIVEVDSTVGKVGTAVDAVTKSIDQLGDAATRIPAAVNLQTIADGANAVVTALQTAATSAQGVSDGIVAAAQAADQAWIAVPEDITAAAGTAQSAAQSILQAFKDISSGISDALASIGPTMADAFSTAVASIESLLTSLAASVGSLVSQMQSELGTLASAISAAQAQLASAQAAASAAGHAGGGAIRGPGGPTSDSILARLSNGEFVIRASAVRHYGEELFSALNSMRFDGFSTGGMVDAMTPRRSSAAFAGGGSVGRPVNLTIDGSTFGMVAPSEVADSLGRFAMSKRARKSGSKPIWYKS